MEIMEYIVSVVSFIFGIIFKGVIDVGVNYFKEKQRLSGSDKAERRRAHEEFLAALIPALDRPTNESVSLVKAKFLKVELSSDEFIVTLGKLVVSLLEANVRGESSSLDKQLPTMKSILIELVRAEIVNRSPDLVQFEEEMLQDPFFAHLSGKAKPLKQGDFQILLDIKAPKK